MGLDAFQLRIHLCNDFLLFGEVTGDNKRLGNQITAPTLVIAGEDDTLSPEPQLLADAIPNGQAMTVPGDHSGAKTTPAFINTVATFLNQQNRTRRT